mmetsp:Transcript_86050/g.152418  ORF Transcript_86050/g.152418 Transcript_86050/m.152418 type:complete len:334 (+) Transcript_86050:59-1060(+)
MWKLLRFVLPCLASAGLFDNFKEKVGSFASAFTEKTSSPVEVTAKRFSWNRSQNIQVYKKDFSSAWCSLKPADAYDVVVVEKKNRGKRFVEQRLAENGMAYSFAEFMNYYAPEKRLAENGQFYTYKEFIEYYGKDGRGDAKWFAAQIEASPQTQKADEKWKDASPVNCTGETCCPKCYEETFDDFWCNYTVNRWVTKETRLTSGQDAYPYSSVGEIQTCPAVKLGCERTLAPSDKFKVDLVMLEDTKKSDTYCSDGEIGLEIFQKFRLEENYAARKRSGYGLLCSTIQFPARPLEKHLANDGKAYTYIEFVDFYGADAAQKWAEAPPAKGEEL